MAAKRLVMQPSVLIVGDSPTDQELITGIIRSQFGSTITIVSAKSVEEAGKILLTNRVDCILLDLALPGFSGSIAVSAIRKFDHTTPIIVVSGDESTTIELEVFARGALSFCRKDKMFDALPGLILEAYRSRSRYDDSMLELSLRLESVVSVLEDISEKLSSQGKMVDEATKVLFGESGVVST
ncbi:MAG: response regulator, partial [Woeseiaceae bacterium]|nr:response regulator [Woeseiaceae bacterium]